MAALNVVEAGESLSPPLSVSGPGSAVDAGNETGDESTTSMVAALTQSTPPPGTDAFRAVGNELFTGQGFPSSRLLGCGSSGCAYYVTRRDVVCQGAFPRMCAEWQTIEAAMGVPLVLKVFHATAITDMTEDMDAADLVRTAVRDAGWTFRQGRWVRALASAAPGGVAYEAGCIIPFSAAVQEAFYAWLARYLTAWEPQVPAWWAPVEAEPTGGDPPAAPVDPADRRHHMARALYDERYLVLPDGGVALRELLHDPLPPAAVAAGVRPATFVHWLQQLQQVLLTVNDADLAHRDLKPANITVRYPFATAPGGVYIVDWGAVKAVNTADAREDLVTRDPDTKRIVYPYLPVEVYLCLPDEVGRNRDTPAMQSLRKARLRALLATYMADVFVHPYDEATAQATTFVDHLVDVHTAAYARWTGASLSASSATPKPPPDTLASVLARVSAVSVDVWGWGATLWCVFWSVLWPACILPLPAARQYDTWTLWADVFRATFEPDPRQRTWARVQAAFQGAVANTPGCQ